MMSFQLGRPVVVSAVLLTLALGATLGLAAAFAFEAGFFDIGFLVVVLEAGFLELVETGALEGEEDMITKLNMQRRDQILFILEASPCLSVAVLTFILC